LDFLAACNTTLTSSLAVPNTRPTSHLLQVDNASVHGGKASTCSRLRLSAGVSIFTVNGIPAKRKIAGRQINA